MLHLFILELHVFIISVTSVAIENSSDVCPPE